MNEPTDATHPQPSYTPSTNGPSAAPAPPDLPPVEAPSAGFIVQLFVIPAVVVFVVILVWLLFGKLAGGERDAMEYVRLIRASSNNERAANRAAFELASLIQNDSKVAADPRLLGELTDVLDHELNRVENPEMAQYVALALGRFQTLDAIAANGQKVDPLATLARALDARYPEGIRIAAAASLAKHGARLDGKLDAPKAIQALAQAGHKGEPALREMTTYALGFFEGDDATTALRDRLNDDDRFVRYNAAVALARRGDPTPLGTLREMLSPTDLDTALSADPAISAADKAAKVESIELEALNALRTAAQEGKADLVRAVRPELDALTRSGLVSVRNSAQALLQSTGGAPDHR